MKANVFLFTDGSCPVPQGPGGWAYILRLESGTEIRKSGGEKNTTNNRMELQGVIEGLKKLPCACNVKLVSDSQYVCYGISKWISGWKRKNWINSEKQPVKNDDLWKEMDRLISLHSVTPEWTRGHAGHPENEWCDVACGQESRRIKEESSK